MTADPDMKPLTKEDMRRMKRVPRAKIIEEALIAQAKAIAVELIEHNPEKRAVIERRLADYVAKRGRI